MALTHEGIRILVVSACLFFVVVSLCVLMIVTRYKRTRYYVEVDDSTGKKWIFEA